jgi:8-oxo-dGTP diphosphatase
MKVNDKYLVIKRTAIKRGKPNSYPLYWDIPGGMVEEGELPTDALIRESKEEVNLDIIVKNIIHEDSNLDTEKNIVFTRLVYLCEVLNNDISNIKLQLDEHNEFKLINSLDEMSDEKVVDYLTQIFKNEKL